MSPPFGAFSTFCSASSSLSDQDDVSISTAGSLPQCNLFFRALLKITEPPALTTLFPSGDITSDTNVEDLVAVSAVNRAGTGVGIRCDTGRMGIEGSLGDIGKPRTDRQTENRLMVPVSMISSADSVNCMFPGRRIPHFPWIS